MVVGRAVAVPGGDTAQQDALCCAFFTTLSVWVDQFSLSVMCTPRNLKLTTLSITVPSMWIGGCSLCCLLKSTIISFVL